MARFGNSTITQPLLFNSVLPWRLHSHRHARSTDIALIVLWLHDTQRFFGETVDSDERKKKVTDFLVQHQGFLRSFARHLVRGTVLDEHDLLQNICRHVLENWSQWRGPAFEPWLREIAKTVFLKEIRREKLRTPVDIGEAAWENVEDLEAGSAADAIVVRLDFNRTMAYLSPAHQEILLLAMKGFKTVELAVMLAIPKGTAMSRLKRARDQFELHASLDQDQDEAEA